jgi:hypothetical protein
MFSYMQAEMTRKQLETLSPPIMKQILPLVEQLPPVYMDLVKGREDFVPKPEETRRLVGETHNVIGFMSHHGALSRPNKPSILFPHTNRDSS